VSPTHDKNIHSSAADLGGGALLDGYGLIHATTWHPVEALALLGIALQPRG